METLRNVHKNRVPQWWVSGLEISFFWDRTLLLGSWISACLGLQVSKRPKKEWRRLSAPWRWGHYVASERHFAITQPVTKRRVLEERNLSYTSEKNSTTTFDFHTSRKLIQTMSSLRVFRIYRTSWSLLVCLFLVGWLVGWLAGWLVGWLISNRPFLISCQ